MDFDSLYEYLKLYTGQDYSDSSPNLSIQNDLGIYGEEAEDFILGFSNKFNVNIDSFDFSAHFEQESDLESKFIINVYKNSKKVPLTINDLKNAIVTGRFY